MSPQPKHVLITGASRGIGRGITLKLAESGAKVAVHYYRNKSAAEDTLNAVRQRGSDGFILQADVRSADEITRMFDAVKSRFGHLDIFVANARPEAAEFFQGPMDITLPQWDAAFDSQAKAFLVAARLASGLMRDQGRIIAVTYAQGSRTGGLQPWVGMGSAKAAMESLVRYFAVALAKRGITVNAISPGWTEDSVLNSLPDQVQDLIRKWHTGGWTPMHSRGRRQCGVALLFARSRLDHRTNHLRRWRRVANEPRSPTRNPIGITKSVFAYTSGAHPSLQQRRTGRQMSHFSPMR